MKTKLEWLEMNMRENPCLIIVFSPKPETAFDHDWLVDAVRKAGAVKGYKYLSSVLGPNDETDTVRFGRVP